MITPKNIGMILLCGALLTAGCSRSPQVTFYTLSTTAVEAPSKRTLPAIVVGAVTLPEFVDRPQLVVADSDNRVDILETHRWSESLKSAIPRVIADNISRQLGSDRVFAYPQSAGNDAEYRISIDLQRFESTADSVLVDAIWTLRLPDNSSVSGRSRARELRKNTVDTLAPAFSRALAVVSADIAQALGKELSRSR